jgi:murein DD-endopeptidase MepM/ murein hydrolase activator NlpD
MRLFHTLGAVLLSAAVAVVSTPALAIGASDPAPARHGVWPLSPRPEVVGGFDPPATRFGRGHRGVDLLGHAGQPVHTSLAGTVTFASDLAGRGVVVVDHGQLRTTYEPVTARVQVGDIVARGEVIGTLQRAASHCFPRACLHWGLRRGEEYLDPLVLVGAGPIRLLPLVGDASSPGGSGTATPLVTGGGRAVRPAFVARALPHGVASTRARRSHGETILRAV